MVKAGNSNGERWVNSSYSLEFLPAILSGHRI